MGVVSIELKRVEKMLRELGLVTSWEQGGLIGGNRIEQRTADGPGPYDGSTIYIWTSPYFSVHFGRTESHNHQIQVTSKHHPPRFEPREFASESHLRKFIVKLIELADEDPMTSAKALRS